MNFGESSFLTQQLSPPDLRAKLHASTMDQGQGRKASSTAGYEEEMEWVNFEELLRSHFFPRLYPPQPQLCLPSFPYGAELQKTGSLLPMGTVRILQFLPLTCNLPGNPSLPQAKLISPFGFQYLNTFVCQALIFFFFLLWKTSNICKSGGEMMSPMAPYPSLSFNNHQLKAKPVSGKSPPAPIMPHASVGSGVSCPSTRY